MAVSIKHEFTSLKADSPDVTVVNPSNWNAEHKLLQATARLLGRTSSGTGPTEEISLTAGFTMSAQTLSLDVPHVASAISTELGITATGESLIQAASAADARAAIGAYQDPGGSGFLVRLANGTSVTRSLTTNTGGINIGNATGASNPTINLTDIAQIVWDTGTVTGIYAISPLKLAETILVQATAVVNSMVPQAGAYVADEVTPAKGGTYTFTHGLGRLPYHVTAELRCETASNGFDVGDVIDLATYYEFQGGAGVAVVRNATNVRVLVSNNTPAITVITPTSNLGVTLTLSNFRLRVRAW